MIKKEVVKKLFWLYTHDEILYLQPYPAKPLFVEWAWEKFWVKEEEVENLIFANWLDEKNIWQKIIFPYKNKMDFQKFLLSWDYSDIPKKYEIQIYWPFKIYYLDKELEFYKPERKIK